MVGFTPLKLLGTKRRGLMKLLGTEKYRTVCKKASVRTHVFNCIDTHKHKTSTLALAPPAHRMTCTWAIVHFGECMLADSRARTHEPTPTPTHLHPLASVRAHTHIKCIQMQIFHGAWHRCSCPHRIIAI